MTDTSIVSTIWAQISTGAKMSIGAREPTACNPTELMCKVLRGRHFVLVRLMGDDTYTVRLLRQRPAPTHEVVEVAKVADVYAEDLSRVLVEMCNQ